MRRLRRRLRSLRRRIRAWEEGSMAAALRSNGAIWVKPTERPAPSDRLSGSPATMYPNLKEKQHG